MGKKQNLESMTKGFFNGLLIGSDPLGTAYSKFSKQKTAGATGWHNNGLGIIKFA